MNFLLERVTGPEIEPITLAEMKLHLRTFATDTSEDAMISGLIQGAREWVEDYTGRVLVDQTWRLTVGDVAYAFRNVDSDTVRGVYTGAWMPSSDGGVFLRKSPVIAITSFKSVDPAGVETTIAASSYELREAKSKWPRLFGLTGATWSGPLRITYRAGFADQTGSPQDSVSVIPVRFIQAMKFWAEAMYDRDEKLMPLLLDVAERLVRPERSELQIA